MYSISLSIHCFFPWLHLFPKPISPSLCHCLMVSSLLLILPLSALSIANQTANTEARMQTQTHAHIHTHTAKGKCCEEQQVVLLSRSSRCTRYVISSIFCNLISMGQSLHSFICIATQMHWACRSCHLTDMQKNALVQLFCLSVGVNQSQNVFMFMM